MPTQRLLPRIQEDILELQDDLRSALLLGFRVVQIDEMMVTRRTFPTHDWAKLRSNTSLDLGQMNTAATAVIGAISREMGVELMMQFPKSVNVMRFKIFLEELRRKYPYDNMILVMDNLAVHRSQHTVERMNELGFRYAWTPRYSPQYNGIEEVWSMSKRYIKEERLNRILRGEKMNMHELISESFDRISILSIAKCINRSIQLLNLNL